MKKIPSWRKVSKVNYFLLGLIAFFSIFPFYWMYVVASNSNAEIAKVPPSVVPGTHFLEVARRVMNFQSVFFNRAVINTLVVGLSVAVLQVIFSAIAGFAFAKLNFKGRNFMVLFVVGTMMLPSQLGLIPMFLLIRNMHLIDSLLALILPAMVTAFGVFWMRQVIDAQIPNELLEAASIDGASVPRIFRTIVLPIIRQSAFVLGLFAFLGAWNDYLWPTVVLQNPKHYTLQVALSQLNPQHAIDYGLQMGGAFLATAPLIILFLFVGKKLVNGVMAGAVKG